MSILIKNVLLDKKETNIYIEDNIIQEIGKKTEANHVIDGKNKAIIPGMVNTHTHAAMCLFRGYADDMKLDEWLQNKIWPLESKLRGDDVYWGTKLACLEMIKTGTTTFNDMYFFMESAAKAVDEMGMRAVLSYGFIDLFNDEKREKEIKKTKETIRNIENMHNDRIKPALGPHAVYTVSEEALRWIKNYADEKGLLVHFHLSETKKENIDFMKKHNKRPVKYLDEIGFLDKKLIAAHCIWLNDDDINLLEKHNVKISHNPASNMKLASGVFNYQKMKKLIISLGTDGCASNNNLDMFEEMKIASLLQKSYFNDEALMPAKEIFSIATENGAKALGFSAGKIEEGKLADVLLIDLKRAELTPNHNLISNLVYSGNGSVIDTTICNGKILMENRKVKGEEEILEKGKKVAEDLINR
ncbi:MAG: amidohydrolase [Candidatus Thermoplasmatota archaeon]|nr:amidohydrolase [Candidatus Thermoplasmatota archaeon]